MAREILAIKSSMTSSFMSNNTIIQRYELEPDDTFENTFSKVSLENILFEIVAFVIWGLENLWDIFRTETETAMARQKPHTREWYRQKVLGFKFGFPVIDGTDEFNLTNASVEQIETASVINQAATIKLISANGYGILRIKVATNIQGNLQEVPPPIFQALKHYMLRYVVDAGTQVKITTGPADDLKLKLDIYFDPIVLSSSGSRLDGTNETPVQDEITAFLKSIDFNGYLIKSDLQTRLRRIEGVKIAVIKEAYSRYGNYDFETENVPNVGIIDEIRVADSGYMKISEGDLEINWRINPE